MSKFLDILRARIDGCGIGDLKQYVPIGLLDEVNVNIDKILERIDSLGACARRGIEVGILQDELVKLGFTVTDVDLEIEDGGTVTLTEFFSNDIYNYFDEDSGEAVNARFHIVFEHDICILHYTKENSSDDNYKFIDYSTFEDLINKVKELIK